MSQRFLAACTAAHVVRSRTVKSGASGLEFPTNSGRSIKRVIVHARSVRNVEEISETGPS